MDNTISSVSRLPNFDHTAAGRTETETGSGNFGSALKNAVEQVEQLHTDAEEQVTELLKGERGDLHNVMIAVEKADVAFQLMMQVRNKIVNAYQEVSRMQF